MAFWFYNALLIVTSPLWGAGLVWRLTVQRKDRRGFRQRWWGLEPGAVPADPERSPRIWIHAVSVGETMAVAPLVRALRRRWPQAVLIGSTVTDLGQETMRAKVPELDLVSYLPFDLWWPVRRTIRAIRPSLFLFAETELWPNTLLSLQRAGVPAVLVNGRVSERSLGRYRWIGPLIRRVVGAVDALAVQGAADRERFIRLGADPARVTICGNLKADGALTGANEEGSLKQVFGLGDEPLVVAGSTHPSEETIMARAFLDLLADARAGGVSPRLCLAPRHLNRCGAVEAELRGLGLIPLRRSRLPADGRSWRDPREVIVLDTMGELMNGYRAAAVAVMGGTLAPIGGHNLLEPAAAGCPVIIGPHAANQAAIADGLVAAGGAVRLQGVEEVTSALRALLRDAPRRVAMSAAARGYVAGQQGATERTMAVIDLVFSADRPSKHRTREAVALRARSASWLNASGGVAAFLKTVLQPAAWVYGAVMALRRAAYRRGWLASAQLPAPVVSIGNLTVGGSGKTPTVIALAEWLQAAGWSVGIVTRGYRGRREQDPLLVSDGRTVTADVGRAGDEAVLLARRLPGVSVAVGRRRAEAGRLVLAEARHNVAPPLILMDDGFQHLALRRDVNLLLLDVGQPMLNGALLPCGPLRERWSAVRDAGAILLVHRSGEAGLDPARPSPLPRLRELGFAGPLFSATIQPSDLVACSSGARRPLQSLAGARVALCSGIGQPGPFREMVAAAGAVIGEEWIFEDHHAYARHEIDTMARRAREAGADMIVTTEKDGVKLAEWPLAGPPVMAVRVRVTVEPEREWRDWLTARRLLPAERSGVNVAIGPDRSAALPGARRDA